MTTPDLTTSLTRKQALRLLALAGGALAGGVLTAPAFAQSTMPSGHEGMGGTDEGMGGMMAAPDASPSTAAYEAAAMKMHAGMDITYTGDADIDFVRGMIAHHQGAIDMAQVVIEYGSDPDIRTLAEGIVAAQQQEIGVMTAWLSAHGG